MTCLILFRHAKAVPAQADDHGRGLAPRGIAEAAWAGQAIAAGGWRPDAAMVSDARRTQETFATALPHLSVAPRATWVPALYEASADEILHLVAGTSPDVGCLLVVGHNPGIATTALRLARHGHPKALAQLADGFPTAAVAVFTLPGSSWAEAAHAMTGHGGTLDAFLLPS